MSTPPKKRIMHSLKLNEISMVGTPAQEGARALLMKRADEPPSPAVAPTDKPAPPPVRHTDKQSDDMNPEAILKNATAFDMGTEPVKFTKADYDDATLAIVRAAKRDDETAEAALVRLLFDDRDPRLEALSRAAMFAPKVSKQQQQQAPVAKSAQEQAWETMQKVARTGAQKGETVEKAMTRLLDEGDSHMMAAAAAYYGWER